MGNDDCHLTNLAFVVRHDGIGLAPHYDLLRTESCCARAFAAVVTANETTTRNPPSNRRPGSAVEARLLRVVQHITLSEMLERLRPVQARAPERAAASVQNSRPAAQRVPPLSTLADA